MNIVVHKGGAITMPGSKRFFVSPHMGGVLPINV